MTNFLDAFRQVAENEGIAITRLEQIIGASKGVLSRAMTNNSDIQSKWVLKLVENYPQYSPEWLLTGKGEMLRAKNTAFNIPTNNENKDIPLIAIDAMSGYAKIENPSLDRDVISSYKIPELDNKGVEYLIRVSGSSMYPKYSNGDLLACRPLKDLSFVQWGKPYTLDTEQGVIVKRLFPCPDDNESLECHSDNKVNYPSFKIPKDSIRSVAIVVGVIRLE